MPYWMNQRNIAFLCISILIQFFMPNPYEWVGMSCVGFYAGFTNKSYIWSKDGLIELGFILTGVIVGGILKGVLA